MYYKSVGRNATLIIGITPDTSGLVPIPDQIRMKEFGDEIRRRFGNPVASAGGRESAVEIQLKEPAVMDQVTIMEILKRVKG